MSLSQLPFVLPPLIYAIIILLPSTELKASSTVGSTENDSIRPIEQIEVQNNESFTVDTSCGYVRPNPPASKYNDDGEKALLAGNLALAACYFKKAAQADTISGVSYSNYATVFYLQDPKANEKTYRSLFMHAIEVDTNNPRTYTQYGNALIGAGQYREGLSYIETANKLCSQDATIRFSLIRARILNGTAGPGDMKMLLQQVDDSNNRDTTYIYLELGRYHLEKSEYKEAIGYLKLAIRDDLVDAEAYRLLFSALARSVGRGSARGHLREIQNNEGRGDVGPYVQRIASGRIYNIRLARRVLNNFYRNNIPEGKGRPAPTLEERNLIQRLAQGLYTNNENGAAKRLLKHFAPESPEIRFVLAEYFAVTGKHRKAVNELNALFTEMTDQELLTYYCCRLHKSSDFRGIKGGINPLDYCGSTDQYMDCGECSDSEAQTDDAYLLNNLPDFDSGANTGTFTSTRKKTQTTVDNPRIWLHKLRKDPKFKAQLKDFAERMKEEARTCTCQEPE